MSVVGSVLSLGELNENHTKKIIRLLKLAKELSAKNAFEGEELEQIPTPRGWKRNENHFTKTTQSEDCFNVTKRAFLPGGGWTLFYHALPIFTGSTVYEATQMADKIARLIAAQEHRFGRRSPPVLKPAKPVKAFGM